MWLWKNRDGLRCGGLRHSSTLPRICRQPTSLVFELEKTKIKERRTWKALASAIHSILLWNLTFFTSHEIGVVFLKKLIFFILFWCITQHTGIKMIFKNIKEYYKKHFKRLPEHQKAQSNNIIFVLKAITLTRRG